MANKNGFENTTNDFSNLDTLIKMKEERNRISTNVDNPEFYDKKKVKPEYYDQIGTDPENGQDDKYKDTKVEPPTKKVIEEIQKKRNTKEKDKLLERQRAITKSREQAKAFEIAKKNKEKKHKNDIIKEEIQKTNTEIKDIWTNTDEELLQELSSSPKTLKEADKLLDIKNKLTKNNSLDKEEAPNNSTTMKSTEDKQIAPEPKKMRLFLASRLLKVAP